MEGREIGRREASSTRSVVLVARTCNSIVTFRPKYFNDRYRRHESLDRNRQSRISICLPRIIGDLTGNSRCDFIHFFSGIIFLAKCLFFIFVLESFMVHGIILLVAVIKLNGVIVCKNKLVRVIFDK